MKAAIPRFSVKIPGATSDFPRVCTPCGLPALRAPATSPRQIPRNTNRTRRLHGPSIHLSHAGPDQDLSGRQEGPGKHQPFLLRSEERRVGKGVDLGGRRIIKKKKKEKKKSKYQIIVQKHKSNLDIWITKL